MHYSIAMTGGRITQSQLKTALVSSQRYLKVFDLSVSIYYVNQKYGAGFKFRFLRHWKAGGLYAQRNCFGNPLL
jgi:hypothetical protein